MNATEIILQLIYLFEDHVVDKSTLVELKHCIEDEEFGTDRSRNIFNAIRMKTLEAERQGRADLLIQWSFEEACAKSLFNFGRPQAPYDPDAPFYIIPFAFLLAKQLKISEKTIICIIG